VGVGTGVWNTDADQSTTSNTGGYSVELKNTTKVTGLISEYYPVSGSSIYRVEFWIRSSSIGGTTEITASAVEYDSAYGYLDENKILDAEQLVAADTWERHATLVATGSTCRFLQLRFYKNDVAFSVFVDSVKIVECGYAFEAYANAATTLTASLWTKVNFAIENLHLIGYDTANSKFVCPSAGLYHFDSNVLIDTTAGNRYSLGLRVNNVLKKNGDYLEAVRTVESRRVSCDIYLDFGDYVEIFAENGEGSDTVTVVSAASNTYFNGHKIM
jgi:hypothetical protein